MDGRLVLLGYVLILFGLIYLIALLIILTKNSLKHSDMFDNRESCKESIKSVGILALVALYTAYEILGRYYMIIPDENCSFHKQTFQYIGVITTIYTFLWFLSFYQCKKYKLSSD